MFKCELRSMRPPCTLPGAIGWGVALSFFVGIFSGHSAMAQHRKAARLNGIQCVEGRADSLGINSNNNTSGVATSSSILTALDQSGVGWIRLAIQWGWIERKPGVYDWQDMDAAINRSLSVHVTPLVDISGPTPCWSVLHPEQGCNRPQHQLPNKDDWSKFVSAAVSRYKDRVHYWEIWNEPNLVQSLDLPEVNQRLAGYREQILIPGAEAIRATDPSAKIAGPVFASNSFGRGALGNVIKFVMKPPATQLIDIVSFHSYSPGDINGKSIEIRDAMRSLGAGDKPIWLTETGFGPENLEMQRPGGMRDVESRQESFLETDVLKALATGNIQKVFWFALTDSHRHGVPLDHFGLVGDSGSQVTPRPAFTALQQLVQDACHK